MSNAEGIVIKKPEEERTVSITDLFRFSDALDGFLIFFGIICSAGTGSISPAWAYIFGSTIDAFNKSEAEMKTAIAKLAITLVVLGVISAILNFGHKFFWTITAERQMKRLREAYMKAVLSQEIAWFDTIGIGQIVTRISGDTILIQNGIGQTCGTIIETSALIIFGLVVGFVRGWELALVVLAATPALTLGSAFVMKMTQILTKKGLKEYATAGNTAEEILSGIRTVTAFGGQKKAIGEYTKQLEAAEKFGVKQSFYSGVSFGFTFLAMYCAFGLTFWYGGRLVAHGHGYTGGKVLSVMWSTIGSAARLPYFGNNLEDFSKARSAAAAIYATIDRKISAAIYSFADQEEEVEAKGAVEFVNVHFSYPTRQEVAVLNGLSLSVKAGQKVALVGKSGCGKSSTIALLQRFYEPSEGSILLDGKDIKSMSLKSLRRQFGYVGQEPVLFSGSIADNIAFGLNITQEQIEEAAQLANAHNFIKDFPQGYQTQVGQRGTQLSGGQKQRIAIARAIVRNPKILLLDEATSALDTESERVVQEALDRVMKGRTTIVIAHRLSTIKDADVIFVVNSGQVAEYGTHEELIAKEGIYKEMVKLQAKPEEHEDNENQHFHVKHETEVTKNTRTSSVSGKGTTKTDEEVKQHQKEYGALEAMKRLLILNKPELLFLIFGVLAAAAVGGFSPLYAIIYSKSVVAYYKPLDDVEDALRPWVLALVALGVAAFVIFFLQTFLLKYAGEKLTTRLRGLSFKVCFLVRFLSSQALLVQDIAWFDRKENSSGALAHMLASDASQLHGVLGPRIAQVITMIVTLLTALGIALYHSWKLTLVILSTVPLLMFANAVSVIVLKGFAEKTRQRVAEANHLASEAVQNVRTVYAFTNEENILNSFSKQLEIPKKYGIRSGILTACMVALSQLFQYPSFALGIWYGGYLMFHNELTFSDLMIVNMTIFQCAMSMGANAALGQVSVTKAAVDGILRILDMKPTILVEGGKVLDAEKCKGEITLKNVQFFYPSRPETKLFRGLDLTVPIGKVVALVGPSGSGKSSIVGLVERFYDPQAGTVLLDGEDITHIDADSLRSQFGLVGQEPVLFSGTIAENIAWGKPDATQEEIEEAAKASNAHNFISEFPQGYQTQVGQRGTQLSGGQKQRIAIARAIVRNPKILLLDEATSALDTESERVVQEALDRVMKGRTTIVIAHKLATIRDADLIFVIDKGRIVESGTHDELWELGGVYHKLVARQM